jgi:hypothetical protein
MLPLTLSAQCHMLCILLCTLFGFGGCPWRKVPPFHLLNRTLAEQLQGMVGDKDKQQAPEMHQHLGTDAGFAAAGTMLNCLKDYSTT